MPSFKINGLINNVIFKHSTYSRKIVPEIKQLYRNAIVLSYQEKITENIVEDIKSHNELIGYAVNASNKCIRDFSDPGNKIEAYLAYCGDILMGFLLFELKRLMGNDIVYISHLATSQTGCSIGRRMVERVLSHYTFKPAIYAVTRRFNLESIILFERRFEFEIISDIEKYQLGYDERYIGFKKHHY